MSRPAPAIVTRGDAGRLYLPDETVDLVVTSPPYFGLRSYQDGGEHYAEQIGAEATPAEYLDALMACTAEWMRVLKPGGSIFVNLGDKYNSGSGAGPQSGLQGGDARTRGNGRGSPIVPSSSLKPKTLFGMPWRYAIRCIDELGLILRAEIIWQKPNGLPESVTDRVRRSHEQVFHFVKQPRYYSAVDEIREQYSDRVQDRQRYAGRDMATSRIYAPENRNDADRAKGILGFGAEGANPLGKLPGSVWSIPTSPLRVPESLGIDHFAAYPPELVRRIVLGWSPRAVCTACGEGRRPVSVSERVATRPSGVARIGTDMDAVSGVHRVRSDVGNVRTERAITGYACACPDITAPATPGVVLDPFGGTGTTALVASVLGRVGISVDLSADYCRLAQWRTTDAKQRAKAAGVKPKAPEKPKPAPTADVLQLPDVPGQIDLFGESA